MDKPRYCTKCGLGLASKQTKCPRCEHETYLDGNCNICLSQDGRMVELWNNGTRHGTFSTGMIHDMVAAARERCKDWGDYAPVIDKSLAAKMKEIDSLICKMAYGKTYE